MSAVHTFSSAMQFAETAARDRAARYRRHAKELRKLAQREPLGRLRSQLLNLVGEYEAMADNLELRGLAPAGAREHRAAPRAP